MDIKPEILSFRAHVAVFLKKKKGKKASEKFENSSKQTEA